MNDLLQAKHDRVEASRAPTGNGAMKHRRLNVLASAGFIALLCGPILALAATAPDLGSTSLYPYRIVSSTYSNTVAGTTINGDVCYTGTGPAVTPTITGNTVCVAGLGSDQNSVLTNLNSQACSTLGSGNLTGTYTPGCYEYASGALSVTGTLTLNGPGVYIFRSGAALNTAANSIVSLANGACADNVFWALGAATTLGANSTFAGNILDPSGITIGSTVNLTGRALAFGGTVSTDTDNLFAPVSCMSVTPTISKTFTPTTIGVGLVSRLTITLGNPTAAAADLSAAFTDTLLGGLVIAPTPDAVTTCTGSGAVVAVAGGATISLPDTRLIPAAVGLTPGSCTVSVNVTAPEGSFPNTLGVNSLQTNNGNNAAPASATLTVGRDVPTLPGWAIIMFTALLSLAGFAAMRRRAV
ncbi:MAG: IPTL-CTERM sorting domain-containing protein [Candidatus Methylomirabilia bacterium]